MHIAIDVRAANTSQLSGVEYYTLQLIQHLLEVDNTHRYTLLLSSPVIQEQIPQPSDRVHHRIITPQKFWPFFRLPLEFLLRPRDYDLFFSPIFAVPFLSLRTNVATFHDLAYELFPGYFSFYERYRQKLLSRISARKAQQLIAVSQSTKNDIIELYNVAETKIRVVYNSYNKDLFHNHYNSSDTRRVISRYIASNKEKPFNTRRVPEPYILFTGTLQGRKGVDVLIKAFDILRSDNKIDHLLVLAGGKGWRDKSIYEAYRAMRHREAVVFTGYIPDRDLPLLYSGADLFVLPSLYEGFGIPILEAMACGTPVITSNISSLPEVGGAAAYYVDSSNVDQLSDAIHNVLTNKGLRESMISKGLKNVWRFSWEKTARQTLAVFEETLSQGGISSL